MDGRAHKPLGISVTQALLRLVHDVRRGFRHRAVRGPNVGLPAASTGTRWGVLGYGLQSDVYAINAFRRREGWDDFVGFLRRAASPQRPEAAVDFDIAWAADNNGDPSGSRYDPFSVTSAAGFSLLHIPVPRTQVSFNWWADDVEILDDWGPVSTNSRVQFPYSGLGYPYGDKAKYQLMSNREIDYPQWESAIDQSKSNWLPPLNSPAIARDIANGYGVSYLVVSFGPVDIYPDSAVTFALALVGGENFRTNPLNFDQFDPMYPDNYKAGLDLSDLLRNVQWARWIYDNPGVDTDRDGFAGDYFLRGEDTVYYQGDGVPDLARRTSADAPTGGVRGFRGSRDPALERRTHRDRRGRVHFATRLRGVPGVHEPDRERQRLAVPGPAGPRQLRPPYVERLAGGDGSCWIRPSRWIHSSRSTTR